MTRYVYDGDQIVAEFGTMLERRYFYGPGIDEPICMLIAANSAKYYYHYDGLGSVVAISNNSGKIVERYSYDVFGEPTIRDANGTVIEESSVGNPYMFTGREYDGETGNYYYRARYYSPAIGRFLSADLLGTVPDGGENNLFDPTYQYEDGINLYTYVGNNPISLRDPEGLYEWEAKGYGRRVSRGFCLSIRWFPHYGTIGARALEMGWCTEMAEYCVIWCHTSWECDESDRDDCQKKCHKEHGACEIRATQKKCKFKFKIRG